MSWAEPAHHQVTANLVGHDVRGDGDGELTAKPGLDVASEVGRLAGGTDQQR